MIPVDVGRTRAGGCRRGVVSPGGFEAIIMSRINGVTDGSGFGSVTRLTRCNETCVTSLCRCGMICIRRRAGSGNATRGGGTGVI